MDVLSPMVALAASPSRVVGGKRRRAVDVPSRGRFSPGARAPCWMVATSAAVSLVALGCGAEPRDAPPSAEPGVIGRAPPASSGMPSVIMLEPDPPRTLPVPTTPAVMDQFTLTFLPNLLVVRAGQPVEFRNSEDVAHNVRVVAVATDSTLFSVATAIGDPYEYTFDRPGGYRVSCDIHPGMAAFLLVVSAPYAVVAEDDGAFAFVDVPPGSYTLTVWNADSTRKLTRRVEIPGERAELTLDATR